MRAQVVASMRLGVSLILMLALLTVVAPAVAAQDAATPVAVPVQSTETSAPVSVEVGCTPDSETGQTTCTFSTGGDTLSVPTANVCAPVSSVVAGAAAGDVYTGAGQVVLVLQGLVSVAGSASYSVSVNGEARDVTGSGLSCVAMNPDTSPDNTDGGTATSPDVGTGDQADNGSADESSGVEPGQGELGGNAAGAPQTDSTTGPLANTAGGQTATYPASDGTEGAVVAAEASPASEITTKASEGTVLSVDVTATVYACATDPGANDPATFAGCSLAQGVTIQASQDGTALPSAYTNATGSATISAGEGSALMLTEDQATLPSGFVPRGNGVNIINPVAAGASVVFVNITDAGTGHLQIVSGTCPTAGEARTEFRIIGARTFGAAATACAPAPGASFTVTGGNIGPEGMIATTGDDASWRGFLPAGTYSLLDGGVSSDAFDVATNAITAIVVINYVPMPRGSLVVTRVLCTEGDQEGTTITVGDTPQAGGPGCAANDSDFRISNAGDGTSGPTQDFTLGPDGSMNVDLTAGQYLLTDLASGQQTTVTVAEGGTTVANVRQVVLTGRAIVRNYSCNDPASNDADASDPTYFTDNCTQPLGGATLTLLDSGNNPVSTDSASGGGIITWSGLVPGDYSISSENGLCAVFAEGQDARGGFTVTVGQTTIVNAYSCAAPLSEPSDAGGPSGNTSDGATDDGTSGGMNTGVLNDASTAVGGSATGTMGDELKNVTQLPNTGIGNRTTGSSYQLLGAFLSLLALTGAGAAVAKRRTDAIR